MRTGAQVAQNKAYLSYLAGRARLGDGPAFNQLVTLQSPRLFAHAYRLLRNREEARDVVQEAWVEITRSLHKLGDDGAFMPWAYRIVSRRAARMIAHNIKDRALARNQPPPPDPPFTDAAAVRAAIERLPPLQGATIRLFYIEEYSLRDVAMAMDVPEGTVKSRLAHAREQLKTHLKGYENV